MPDRTTKVREVVFGEYHLGYTSRESPGWLMTYATTYAPIDAPITVALFAGGVSTRVYASVDEARRAAAALLDAANETEVSLKNDRRLKDG